MDNQQNLTDEDRRLKGPTPLTAQELAAVHPNGGLGRWLVTVRNLEATLALTREESEIYAADAYAERVRRIEREQQLEAARASEVRLRALLKEVEFADTNDDNEDFHHCPICYAIRRNGQHKPDCRLAAALTAGSEACEHKVWVTKACFVEGDRLFGRCCAQCGVSAAEGVV